MRDGGREKMRAGAFIGGLISWFVGDIVLWAFYPVLQSNHVEWFVIPFVAFEIISLLMLGAQAIKEG